MSLSIGYQNLNKKIPAEGEPQLAVIRLGQLAQSDIAPGEFMRQSTALIAQSLAADYVFLWEVESDKNHVSLQASTGWNGKSYTSARKRLVPACLEQLTLTSPDPIAMENLQQETRFDTSNMLVKDDVTSGASILIGTVEEPLGVLEVFMHEAHIFSEEEYSFLQGAAIILGLAISRQRVQADLAAENRELKKQLANGQSAKQSGRFEGDSYEIKNRLSESREKERLRLAQELHDFPIQDLYGLIYQVDDLREFIKDPEAERILDEHSLMLNRVVNGLRTICGELRPPSLSPFGLEVAIRDHVEKLRDQVPQINIELQLMRDQQLLSDSLRLNLFRVYQQAMSNVVRHAEATEVHIRFGWDENMIILEVEDNGKGFEVPKSWVELVRQDQFGLVGLAERVEGIRGKLEIISALGNGTLVRAIVPRR